MYGCVLLCILCAMCECCVCVRVCVCMCMKNMVCMCAFSHSGRKRKSEEAPGETPEKKIKLEASYKIISLPHYIHVGHQLLF